MEEMIKLTNGKKTIIRSKTPFPTATQGTFALYESLKNRKNSKVFLH